MDNKFLRLCGKSIKANRNKFGRDFAVFSKKRNKKTRQLLKTKRADTFGNWPVSVSNDKKPNVKHNTNEINVNDESISSLDIEIKKKLLNARKLRRKYDIYVFPETSTTPLPIFKFEQLLTSLNVNKTIFSNLKKWKISRPLPVQMQVIPIMIKGHELQCCAPTGCGKTISFIIPILSILQHTMDINDCNAFCNDDDDEEEDEDVNKDDKNDQFSDIKCLIVAPTTVLVHQIYREFIKYSDGLNIGIHLLDENKSNQINQINVMISTPKTLAKLINENKIPFNKIQIVVLDEADELFDADKCVHLNDIELIISSCQHPHIQRAFFSATLDHKIMNITEKFLNDPYKISIGSGICGAMNISQELKFCGDERGKFIELLKIIENGIKPPVLVFVSDDDRIISLKNELKNYQSHLMIDALHKNLSINEKNEIIKDFKNEKIWFLICNDILSRGMDFLNVSTVINYDFPKTSQQYIHRIGRTGRADKCGKAITFWTDVDYKILSIVIDVMKQSNQLHKIPKWIINNCNKKRILLNEKQTKVIKLGITKRGPIRRGGEYVHGTSVLKTVNKNKKTKKQKKKQKYYLNKRRKLNNMRNKFA